MAIIQFETEFLVEVMIGNAWFEKVEPTASLGHAIRMAKKLILQGYEEDHVRVIKHTERKEVLEIDLKGE